ncbi:MAG: ATP-binding protein [Planctomycetia bacterium]|nr:ATP-binding protein [Planctomycetia bacterium]
MSKLIAFAGLPGTGKSTLAKALCKSLNAVLLNKDDIRAALFASENIEYSGQQNDFCMDILYQLAVFHAERNPDRHIIIDGRTFSKSEQLMQLRECTTRCQRDLILVECVCSDNVARSRLRQDHEQSLHPAADRNEALYDQVKATSEPIALPSITVNTEDESLERNIQLILQAVRLAK